VRQVVRILRRLGSYAITLVMIWLAGLTVFIISSVLVRVDADSPTDAVVVLTGGRLRLETGLALLDQGKATMSLCFVAQVGGRPGITLQCPPGEIRRHAPGPQGATATPMSWLRAKGGWRRLPW